MSSLNEAPANPTQIDRVVRQQAPSPCQPYSGRLDEQAAKRVSWTEKS